MLIRCSCVFMKASQRYCQVTSRTDPREDCYVPSVSECFTEKFKYDRQTNGWILLINILKSLNRKTSLYWKLCCASSIDDVISNFTFKQQQKRKWRVRTTSYADEFPKCKITEGEDYKTVFLKFTTVFWSQQRIASGKKKLVVNTASWLQYLGPVEQFGFTAD